MQLTYSRIFLVYKTIPSLAHSDPHASLLQPLSIIHTVQEFVSVICTKCLRIRYSVLTYDIRSAIRSLGPTNDPKDSTGKKEKKVKGETKTTTATTTARKGDAENKARDKRKFVRVSKVWHQCTWKLGTDQVRWLDVGTIPPPFSYPFLFLPDCQIVLESRACWPWGTKRLNKKHG